MKTNIGKLITTIVTGLLSTIIIFIGYGFMDKITSDSNSISRFIYIPLGIILSIALVGLLFSSVVTSITGIWSCIVPVKVISILLLILTIIDLIISGYLINDFIKAI